MYSYQYLSSNLQYKLKEGKLIFRFKYEVNQITLEQTNEENKWRIVSCTRNKLPWYFDRRLDLRFNVNVRKSYFNTYKEELIKFSEFSGLEILDKAHNSKLVLENGFVKIIVLYPDRSESEMWISQTRKSKVLSSFTVPSDISLPFSRCLEIYFSIYTPRDFLEDDSDFEIRKLRI